MSSQKVVGKPAIHLSGEHYVISVSVTKNPQSGKKIEMKLFDLHELSCVMLRLLICHMKRVNDNQNIHQFL